MYFVFICCLVAILFAWFESKGLLNNGLKIGFIVITLVSALRYDYGCDYLGYIEDFKDASSYSIIDILTFNEDIREPGWYLLMKIFEPFGVYVFFAFLAVVTSYIYYRFIKENVQKKDYWLAMSIYLLNFDLFILQQSMMRQALTMAIFIWGFRYIKEINQFLYSDDTYNGLQKKQRKNFIRSLFKLSLVLTIIVFIHQSSIVLIPVSLIAFINMRKRKLIVTVLLVTFSLLWISSNYVAPIFEQLMLIDSIAFYGEKYSSDFEAQFGIRQILSFIPFFVSLYYLWDRKTISVTKPLVVISMLGILVLPFAGLFQLIARISYYFDAFTIAAYPIVYRNIKNKYIRYSLIMLFLLIFVYMWLDKSKNPVWGGKFMEYHTLFEIL
ncbi:MAG: EpsG family protein [Bacteroidales bacterium]|nr:EpsG family protein [Bacteroidales bacterium]